MIIKRLLMPWHVAQVRERRQQYGDVTETIAKRAVSCRCCGKPVRKGEAALSFYWDFDGCGSWTATGCYMHPTCEPAPEAERKEINRARLIETLERRLIKLDHQWNNAGPKVQQRLEKEIANVEEHLSQLRAAAEVQS